MKKLIRLFCEKCEVVLKEDEADEGDACQNCQEGTLLQVVILVTEPRS